MTELVGLLEEEGYSEADIDEMLSPMDRYEGRPIADSVPPGDDGADLHDAVRATLIVARNERTPPGPQVTSAPGTPAPATDPKVVRVDTEDSHRMFRRRMAAGDIATDDDLDELSGNDREFLGLVGLDSGRAQGGSVGSRPDQNCVLCGAADAGSAICEDCRVAHSRHLNAILGFEGRGAASNIYGTRVGYTAYQLELRDALVGTASESELLGYTARQMELMGYTARQMELMGYTARQMELIGDADALEEGTPGEDEFVPLSFADPEDMKHIAAWKSGKNIYSSIRITGWDGQPKILTATTPYAKSLGAVCGYMAKAGVSPAAQIAIADPLARQLGAGGLIPRLAAASPGLLGLARSKRGPFLAAVGSKRGRG